MLKGGMADYALVIGAETFSRLLDWEDRTTCVLFGDGAGAIILQAEEAQDRGILATKLHADGRHNDLLYVDGGVSTTGTVGKLRMKGKEVFRHAVVNLAEVLNEVLTAAGHSADEVDWVVPHQANKRISMRRHASLGSIPRGSSSPSISTPTPPPPRFRWRSMSPFGTAGSKRTTLSCWKRWGAALLGAQQCYATDLRKAAIQLRYKATWIKVFHYAAGGEGVIYGGRRDDQAITGWNADARRPFRCGSP
jgi:hypothetical protein